jgi:hypothetical protein
MCKCGAEHCYRIVPSNYKKSATGPWQVCFRCLTSLQTKVLNATYVQHSISSFGKVSLNLFMNIIYIFSILHLCDSEMDVHYYTDALIAVLYCS